MGKTSFLLTKWYLDCVAQNGDTVVLYVADLRWNALTVHYGSLLTVLGGMIRSTSSVRKSAVPEIQDRQITVKLPHLDIEGSWNALRLPFFNTVYESERGAVEWHCLQPMSRADLLLRGTTRFTGLGYAECLTLSIPPWKLPLTELHWGRFLSDGDALVWMDWRGPHQHCVALHNDQEHQAKSVTESEIVLVGSEARLELDHGLVLREGRLGDTVFPGLSSLAQLLPRSMLSVNECKWRSRGVFHTAGGQSTGWAIHEVVKWSER